MVSLSQMSAITGTSVYKLRTYIDRGELHASLISGVYSVAENECDRFRREVLHDTLFTPMTNLDRSL